MHLRPGGGTGSRGCRVVTRPGTMLPPPLAVDALRQELRAAARVDLERDTEPPSSEPVSDDAHDTWPDTVGFGGAW